VLQKLAKREVIERIADDLYSHPPTSLANRRRGRAVSGLCAAAPAPFGCRFYDLRPERGTFGVFALNPTISRSRGAVNVSVKRPVGPVNGDATGVGNERHNVTIAG